MLGVDVDGQHLKPGTTRQLQVDRTHLQSLELLSLGWSPAQLLQQLNEVSGGFEVCGRDNRS